MRVVTFDAGLCNMGVCIFNSDTNQIEYLRNINLFAQAKSMPSFPIMAERINTILNEIQLLLNECDVLVMEKQVRVNQKACRVAVHIMSWFTITLPHVKVIEMHAKQKTKHQKIKPGRKYYKDRKIACEQEALSFLIDSKCNSYALSIFLNEPKKDDVADAICMALVYTLQNK